MNLYSYVINNPVNYTDSTGQAIDIFADIGFIGFDLYKLGRDALSGCKGNLKGNLAALGGDVVGALIPGLTGVGLGIRGVGKATTKTIVIGENMAERVIPYANKIGAKYYNPTKTVQQMGGLKKALQGNIQWVKDMVSKGYKVLDVGPKGKNPTSFFYKAEVGTLKKLGVLK